MDAEFSRELIERQQFALARQIDNGASCALQDRQRNSAPSAVPGAQGFERRAEQRCKRLLIQTDRASKVTKLGGHVNTMPSALLLVKRPPAYMAGDRSIQMSYSFHITIVRSIETLRETARAECGAHSRYRSLFSVCVRLENSSQSILANSFRKWRARQDSITGSPSDARREVT